MELFVAGFGLGLVLGFIAFWNRTHSLEDKLDETEAMLEKAKDMIIKFRIDGEEWQEVKKTCGSGDLFGKW